MNAQAHEVIPAAESLPISNATTLLMVIEKAATNPAVDIDKMERLMQMHERIVARDAEAAFNDAMTACQAEMRPISADAKNPQTKSDYATYGALDRKLRPIYTKHGFSISYDTDDSLKAEHIKVLAYVSRGGYSRTYKVDMPADGKGAKGGDVMTKTHATGAAMSYGQRYLLKGIFNVRIGEEDDDGNLGASGMTDEEYAAWVAKIKAATTKEAAKEICVEAIKVADAHNDLAAYKSLKEVLKEQTEFIAKAGK